MKKLIAILAVFVVVVSSAFSEETTAEKLAAAKAKQAELQKEILKLENPSAKDQGRDVLILVKRQYSEVSSKVALLTKELVEKLKNK